MPLPSARSSACCGNHWIQWLTYIVIFCTGVIRAFAGPALNAIIAQIVPKEKLPGAVTLNTSAFLFASVTGHATAGFLIANTTYLFSFSVVAAYVIIAWICLFTLSPKQIMVTEEKKYLGKHQGRAALRRPYQRSAGRARPRPFCRPFWRRSGPHPCICARYPARRPHWFRLAQRGRRHRLHQHDPLAYLPAAPAPSGKDPALRSYRIRRLHHRLRPVEDSISFPSLL